MASNLQRQTAGTASLQIEASRSRSDALENNDGKPRFHGCSRITNYEVMGKLGEGTFGEVHKARSRANGNFVALKKILMHNEKDGFPITALREIKLLKMLSHPNILKLEEMAVEHRKKDRGKKAVMYMVTPYMDHDLSGLLENPAVKITEPQIKCYMIQLLKGLKYLHGMQILHRDMKAANLLISNKGILQIADFGLARPYDDPPPKPGKGGGEATRDYTTLVVTRWYRPPELLLQLRKYTTAIDLWGVGCVFGEMFKGRPILAGKSDLHQIESIFQLVGSPSEDNMPGWSALPGCEGVTSFGHYRNQLPVVFREQGSAMISLISELLTLDWRGRINAMDALKHPYFTTAPLPLRPGDIPQFEESHELDRRKFRDQQAALPPAPAGGTVGMGPHQGEWGGGANGYAGGRRQGPPQHQGGPPRNGYDNRVPHHQGGRDRDRRPAWQGRDRDRGHESSLPPGPHNLPPRPANNASWTGWAGEHKNGSGWAGEDRGPPRQRQPPRAGVGGAGGGGGGAVGGDMDTYIPNYSGGAARPDRYDRDRPPRAREDRDRGRDDRERDRGQRDERRRSRSPVSRIRDNVKEVYGRR
ncbi:MAG: serine/threonine protein kinase, CMGC, CDC2/CDK sub [Stictis urceolatum]|nr:serine/threonine protein kinase, CMGC, CDC2/CDK sub [Stictis urceolata]